MCKGPDAEQITECLESGGVTVVEWGEKALDYFPKSYLRVKMAHQGPNRRGIQFHAEGDFQLKEIKGKNNQWRIRR